MASMRCLKQGVGVEQAFELGLKTGVTLWSMMHLEFFGPGEELQKPVGCPV